MDDLRIVFDDELLKTGRAGIEDLIAAMDEGGFYEAPCSGKVRYHSAYRGGLLDHSLKVLEVARKINKSLGEPIADESIVIAALLHDMGKMGDYGKPYYVDNILKEGQSKAEPFKHNKELFYLSHEYMSAKIASQYIRLTQDEEFAIVCHNGLYGQFAGNVKNNETKLYLILHFADMYASRFMEKGEG